MYRDICNVLRFLFNHPHVQNRVTNYTGNGQVQISTLLTVQTTLYVLTNIKPNDRLI